MAKLHRYTDDEIDTELRDLGISSENILRYQKIEIIANFDSRTRQVEEDVQRAARGERGFQRQKTCSKC